GDEFNTRRRIVTRGFTSLARYPELINPARMPLLAWQIFSHKILRWMVGFYYLGMLVSSLLLATRRFFLLAFGSLFAILCLSIYALRVQDVAGRWYAIPYYFVLVNLASVLGVIDYLRGRKVISWKPVRQ
ncbi:MAG TPA: hypothetical protein P5553_09770, partial [Desulfomonilia bacterium]|nr:hypothetical protein [Desulfomonilia bacterium]